MLKLLKLLLISEIDMSLYSVRQYELNSSLPVSQQIYQYLRKEIVECMILPSTSLSEKDISSRFSVSRQPVREAFIKLSENGLVQILPQRGTFVKKISLKKVIDGRFVRAAIERCVVVQACKLISPIQISLLEHNLDRQALAVQNDRLSEFLALDDEFHKMLAESANCPFAWEVIENIKTTMDRVRYISLSQASHPSSLLEQHKKIFLSIKEKKTEVAEIAVQEHLDQIVSTIEAIGRVNSEWFEN
ncbi:MAG: GntR family transcriptional regulator [Aeromonas veronii]